MLYEIETERLLLRPFQRSDANDIFEYSQNPNVGPNAGWPPHKTLRDSKQAVRSFIENGYVWAVVDKVSNKVIGTIGLHPDEKRQNSKARMLGYSLSEDYWGRGLATEAAKAVIRYAFNVWHVELLSIYRYPENVRSGRVIEKCGFTYEGTLKKAFVLYDGTVRDHVCYCMTRDEFDKLYGY